jgi:hypothetical protein
MSQSSFVRKYNTVQKAWANLLGALVNFFFSFVSNEEPLIAQANEAPTRQAFRRIVVELISLGSASVALDLESGRIAAEVLGPFLYVPNPFPGHRNQPYLAIGPEVIGVYYFTDTNFFIVSAAPSVLPIEYELELMEAIQGYLDQYYEITS